MIMKVIDLWKENKKPSVSFELFPARTPKAEDSLNKAIDRLADLRPDFVSVTFGAGGSTTEGSHELVDKLHNEKGLEILAYVACYGLSPDNLESVLTSYRGLGVENILTVRGDAPRDAEDFAPDPDSFAHATDFIPFVRSRFDFCLGAAAYPEGHVEAESKEKDLEYLKLKIDRGAEYLIANYFYDNRFFFGFVERCRAFGIDVPIIPGVMPIYSVKMMENLAKLCGATITDELKEGLSAIAEDDKEGLLSFSVDFAVRQCRELIEEGVPGLHLYTMDRSKTVSEIVKQLRSEGLID